MATFDKEITLVIDVDKRIEPLVCVDTNGLWHETKLESLLQGDIRNLVIKLARIGVNGSISYLDAEGGDTMSVTIKRRNLEGDPLFSVESMSKSGTSGSEIWSGILSLHTIDGDEAISDYDSIPVKMEIFIKNSSGTERASWQMDTTVTRKVYGNIPPVVPGGPSYYTTDEADALFAKRTGPSDYATKLVEIEGLLYWAQLVGEKWVVQKIIEVEGNYTFTFVEVE